MGDEKWKGDKVQAILSVFSVEDVQWQFESARNEGHTTKQICEMLKNRVQGARL